MSNIEKLKQELILQQQTIESLGGQVVVANRYPSPSEITKGISTIDVPDLTGSTATEADVMYGKTFFSKDDTLRVGTYNDVSVTFKHVYEYQPNVRSTENVLNYNLPSDIKTIKNYAFYQNKNNVQFHFHENLETIGIYAFAEASNFTFDTLENLTKLTIIPERCFDRCNLQPEILENLPKNLTNINLYSFYGTIKENANIKIPANVTTVGSYSFTNPTKTYANSVVFENASRLSSFGSSVFENIIFNCDFIIPKDVTGIPYKFAYNGSFNNIVMSNNMSALYQYCFGASTNTPVSDVRLRTVTFSKVNPPGTFYDTCFPTQAKENGLKIYVPDESLEAYKNKMASFAGCIVPVSQKE